jgi:hypothetical protein
MAQKAFKSNAPHSKAEKHRLRHDQLGKHLVRITSSEWDNEQHSGARLFSLGMLPGLPEMDASS